MHNRVKADEVTKLKIAIIELMRAGWRRELDIPFDLREKIASIERLSSNTADQHLFLFNQDREEKTFISYLLIAMKIALEEYESGER